MEQPLAAPKHTSAIPRPGSKLPLLRPTQISHLPRPASPEAKTGPALGPAPSPASHRQSVVKPLTKPTHRINTSTASSHSSNPRPSSKENPLNSVQRVPLWPSSRPQSRHDSAVDQASFEQHVAAARNKGFRHPSQQENTFYITDSQEESDGSTERSASIATSPVPNLNHQPKQPPRLSLSDRTVESLSSLPPSPAAMSRRRSSFFNPQSPMVSTPRVLSRPSSRPSSSMGQTAMPKLNLNSGRSNGIARPHSPTKRTEGGAPPSTPARRSVSSALPKTAASALLSPHERVESTPKAIARPVGPVAAVKFSSKPTAIKQIASPRQRPMSMMGPPARAGLATQSRLAPKTINGAAQPRGPSPALPSSWRPTKAEVPVEIPEQPTKTSAGFRTQIAAAKAAHRVSSIRPSNDSPATYNFDECEDPFNQGVQEQSVLSRRIDAARRDGRLNIAAMDFKQIPEEVLTMYDSQAMEASSVSWNETVDLVRLNAADNSFEELSRDAFPDASPAVLASMEDAKGNQFGGLENLDLHGNLLRSVPIGLRRLERLTSLNLTRNKLDNAVFDVVTQISCLRELHLGGNDLTKEVPDSVGQLSSLEVLDLHENKLSALPGSVRNLVNLRVLNLSSNRFAELPIGSIFSLPSLKEVYAASNALTGAFFPMTVDIVRSLQTLDISNNSLASISFGSELHLPSIQYLNISCNRLFALPNISSWSNIITLLVEENGLSSLPDGLTSLDKLKVADFQRNSLRTVEAEIANMDALEVLGIAANPLREKKLLNMSTALIKEEMARRLALAAAAT